jgi:dTDP-4-dehydrorhamnose 3,5-epimerase
MDGAKVMSKIDGLDFKVLTTYIDPRGELTELARNDWFDAPIQQAYITSAYPGIIKAWHLHKIQTDRMVCIKGIIYFGFCEEFNTNEDGEVVVNQIIDGLVVRAERPVLITIKPNIWHGFKNIGREDAVILNCPDRLYNYDDPDEYRMQLDRVNFDWSGRDA